MISEKTLRRWRKDALLAIQGVHSLSPEGLNHEIIHFKEVNERILRLTQELMDANLLRKS